MADAPFAPLPNTGTLADTVTPLPEFAPVRPTAAPIEDPATLGELFHSSDRLQRQDNTDASEMRLRDGYKPIVEELGLDDSENPINFYDNNGHNPILIYSGILASQGRRGLSAMTDRITQETLIAGLIRERRAKDPKSLPGVPDTVDGLHKYFLEQAKVRQKADQATVARSPGGLLATGAKIAGGIVGAAHDPFNQVTAVLGGGGKTLLQVVAREAVVNGTLAAIVQPIVAQNRAELGEHLTFGEAVQNTVLAAALGSIVGGTLHLGGKALSATARPIVEKVRGRVAKGATPEEAFAELDNRELSTLARETIGEDKLTPDEKAAINVLERSGEVAETSPYEPGAAGAAAHEGGLAAALQDIENGRVPEELPAGSPRPVEAGDASPPARPRGDRPSPARPQDALNGGPSTPTGAAGPVRLPMDIVDGLKARGIPDHIARGAAAGIFAESAADPRALNKSSGAIGYGQWLGSRKRELLRRYGPAPTREQQLDFLAWELKGGDAGGSKVLAAKDEVEALNAYIRDFMRPAAGKETDGDLSRGMAALGRAGEDLPEGAVLHAGAGELEPDPMVAQLRAEALDLDNEISGMVAVPGAGDVPIYRQRVPASSVLVDADRFQFKSGGDAEGVIDTLKGIKRWDPLAAGTLTFWQDREGRIFVADGHQRSGLARRIEAQTGEAIALDGHVLRESDGVSSEMARAIAALNNIRNGSTSRIDAAKVLRDLGFEADLNLPPKSALARDAEGLARLSDPAFGAVVNEHIAADIAAVVGRLLPDHPELHESMVGLLMKIDPARVGQAESIVRQAVAAGLHSEEQIDLFGSSEVTRSLFLEKAKIVEGATGELRKLRVVHNTAATHAGTLEKSGSRIARERSAKEAQRNAETASIIEKLYTRAGPVADALDAAARFLAGGGKRSDAVARFIADVDNLDLQALARGTEGGDRGLELPSGRGREGEAGEAVEALPLQQSADDQPGLLELEQPTAAELSAAAERFSDPDGPAVRQQAESLSHDLKADVDARATRREAIKAATAALEDVQRGEFRAVEPFPQDEPGYHRFRYVAEDGTAVGGNYTIDNGPPPFVEGFNVGDANNPVKLGAAQVRKLFDQLRAQHPEITRVHAFRMTGARAEAGSGPKEIWIDLSGKAKPEAGTVAPEDVEIHGEAPSGGVLHGGDLSKITAEDLPALFDELPADRDAWHDLRVRIVNERPDLAADALDQMDRAPAEAKDPAQEARFRAIDAIRADEAKDLVEAVKKGQQLVVTNALKTSYIKHDWQVRATSKGFQFRMNGNKDEWFSIGADDHAHLMAQIGKQSRQFEPLETTGGGAPPASPQDQLASSLLERQAAAADQELHIADQVANALEARGFTRRGDEFEKHVAALAPKGQLSDGTRVVSLRMDPSGRYLERLDGFDVANDVDLREFANDPEGAIAHVLTDKQDPAVAERLKQELALRAGSPLRPGDVDAKGEIGLELFDQANQHTFRLSEEGDEISAEDLLGELDADEKAVKSIKDCL